MTLSGIPAHLLAKAAADPRNAGAQDALRRAAGLRGQQSTPEPANGAQRGKGAAEGVSANFLLTPARLAGTVTVVLPLPPKELSPNARVHWARKARAVKEYRALADNATFCACIAAAICTPQWERATAQATFYFPDLRRRDRDNLLASLKSAFDGIADARVVANDSGLTHLPVRVEVDRERPRVEVTVARGS